MHSPKQQELQKAIHFVKQSLDGVKMKMDYSTGSVHHLDYTIDEAFKNGQLKNPQGAFAQYKAMIMLGMAGYLAEVIIKHTAGSQIVIDENDPQWYMNFKLTGTNGWAIQPAQRVIERAYRGNKAELHAYAIAAIKHFNQDNVTDGSVQTTGYTGDSRKPWWKFW